jgi:uncharacterized protein Yka (UPF0111/DUF47 family)
MARPSKPKTFARTKQRKNAKSGINKLSDVLYSANKLLRDVNALEKGKVIDRIERRVLGKLASKGLSSNLLKIFRKH